MSNDGLPEYFDLAGTDIDRVEVSEWNAYIYMKDGRTLCIGVTEAWGLGLMTRAWVEASK